MRRTVTALALCPVVGLAACTPTPEPESAAQANPDQSGVWMAFASRAVRRAARSRSGRTPQRRTAYYQRMADTATLEYTCSAKHWLAELEKNRVSE